VAALKDIRRKIRGIQKTRQITKAMNMVAAAKFKNSHLKMENFLPYGEGIASLAANLIGSSDLEGHPLFATAELSPKVRLVVFSSDRGLCGGFNNNLFKFTQQFFRRQVASGREVVISPVGRKGWEFFRKKELPLEDLRGLAEGDLLASSQAITARLMEVFQAGKGEEIYLLFNRFLNVSLQRPVAERFLPLQSEGTGVAAVREEFIFEPSREELLTRILPIYLTSRIHRVFLETQTGENGARMVAMDNATKNCDEMSSVLTLKLNKARQAAITAELMDIVGGAEALAQA
jgi:F-type H+-transporting ATPase subunit gamma